MKKTSTTKTSKHAEKPAKKPSKALREAAKIVGSLGGRPRKNPFGQS